MALLLECMLLEATTAVIHDRRRDNVWMRLNIIVNVFRTMLPRRIVKYGGDVMCASFELTMMVVLRDTITTPLPMYSVGQGSHCYAKRRNLPHFRAPAVRCFSKQQLLP
jgi:hypothetical protein